MSNRNVDEKGIPLLRIDELNHYINADTRCLSCGQQLTQEDIHDVDIPKVTIYHGYCKTEFTLLCEGIFDEDVDEKIRKQYY